MKDANYINGIDGLRAVAVLAIIVFHLDPSWLPGGFVGVDIFFVISGFVVAYSVGKADHLRLRDYFLWFYRRRLTRIYPVLLVFLFVTLVASTLFIPLSDKFIELTGAAAVFGVSNMLLWLKAGDYFSATSEYNIFTHTWSLAVEEQYYLLFPVFSYFILVKRNVSTSRLMAGGIVVASILSLALCAYLSLRRPEAAFYLFPARFWELALGFLLYLVCYGHGRVRRVLPSWLHSGALAWLGAGAIAVSLVLADSGAFPFPWALVPTFGATLLILASVLTPDHPVAKLLGLRPLTWIGRISFSLYLWHWSVIVLMKWTIGIDSLLLKLLAVVIMTALSVASYYLVENPARKSVRLTSLPTPAFYASSLIAFCVVAGIGVGAFLYKPVLTLSVTGDQAVWDTYSHISAGRCEVERTNERLGAGQILTYSPLLCAEPKGKVLVMGDSHAGAYNRLFERLAAEEGYLVVSYTMGGCKLIDHFDPQPIAGCADFRAAALGAIATAAGPGDIVFFSGHYSRRYRDAWHNNILDTEDLVAKPFSAEDVQNVGALVSPIVGTGARVVLEGPKPISRTALFRCADWFTVQSAYCADTGVSSREDLILRSGGVAKFQLQLAETFGTELWEPFDLLCPSESANCPVYSSGLPLFNDTDHLSGAANDLVFPAFVSMLNH